MSKQHASGRRRAGAPVPTARPRDAQRLDRRRRATRVRNDLSVTGLSQKIAIAAAASGLVLTIALPTTAASIPAEDMPDAAGAAAAVIETAVPRDIKVPAAAPVDFSRTALQSTFDADVKLSEIMTAAGSTAVPAAARGSLSAPMKELVLTSPFGYRVSPITGMSGELHSGQDFSSSCGSEVFAAAAGTVTFAGWHPYGGGNRVVIDHGNGLESSYNHLSLSSVNEGQKVDRAQVVAQSGSTGASTGCHLHFEVMVDGQTVDPMGWL
ncbi:M23 family metallopeptidase [Arthrobacter sp. TMN-50]